MNSDDYDVSLRHPVHQLYKGITLVQGVDRGRLCMYGGSGYMGTVHFSTQFYCEVKTVLLKSY